MRVLITFSVVAVCLGVLGCDVSGTSDGADEGKSRAVESEARTPIVILVAGLIKENAFCCFLSTHACCRLHCETTCSYSRHCPKDQ